MPSAQSKKHGYGGTPASSGFHVKKETINTTHRKLQATWTIDTQQDSETVFNHWELCTSIKEAIERDMLLKVLDDFSTVMSDCVSAISETAFVDWYDYNDTIDNEQLEHVRSSFRMLASACDNISEHDRFTLIMAGITQWPEQSKQVSQQATNLATIAIKQSTSNR